MFSFCVAPPLSIQANLAELLWKAPLFTPLIRKIHLSDQGNVVAAVSVLLALIVKDVS